MKYLGVLLIAVLFQAAFIYGEDSTSIVIADSVSLDSSDRASLDSADKATLDSSDIATLDSTDRTAPDSAKSASLPSLAVMDFEARGLSILAG